jgi:hypothetical protein
MEFMASRIFFLVAVNIIGAICLLLPLICAALSLMNERWGLALVSVLSFFLLKQLLFLVENKLGVRSLGNPEAHSHGAGITIVAPWVSRTMHGRRKHRQRTGILLGDQPRQPVDAGGQ